MKTVKLSVSDCEVERKVNDEFNNLAYLYLRNKAIRLRDMYNKLINIVVSECSGNPIPDDVLFDEGKGRRVIGTYMTRADVCKLAKQKDEVLMFGRMNTDLSEEQLDNIDKNYRKLVVAAVQIWHNANRRVVEEQLIKGERLWQDNLRSRIAIDKSKQNKQLLTKN